MGVSHDRTGPRHDGDHATIRGRARAGSDMSRMFSFPVHPDIPARLYLPEGDRPLAVVVYFHAGGWALGDYDDIDTPVRALANRSGCAVLSVNYRLGARAQVPSCR